MELEKTIVEETKKLNHVMNSTSQGNSNMDLIYSQHGLRSRGRKTVEEI